MGAVKETFLDKIFRKDQVQMKKKIKQEKSQVKTRATESILPKVGNP